MPFIYKPTNSRPPPQIPPFSSSHTLDNYPPALIHPRARSQTLRDKAYVPAPPEIIQTNSSSGCECPASPIPSRRNHSKGSLPHFPLTPLFKGDSVNFFLYSGFQIQENFLCLLKSCLISPRPRLASNLLATKSFPNSVIQWAKWFFGGVNCFFTSKEEIVQVPALFKDLFI